MPLPTTHSDNQNNETTKREEKNCLKTVIDTGINSISSFSHSKMWRFELKIRRSVFASHTKYCSVFLFSNNWICAESSIYNVNMWFGYWILFYNCFEWECTAHANVLIAKTWTRWTPIYRNNSIAHRKLIIIHLFTISLHISVATVVNLKKHYRLLFIMSFNSSLSFILLQNYM